MFRTFQDGTSNTFGLTEHYVSCNHAVFMTVLADYPLYPIPGGPRPATFSDAGINVPQGSGYDNYPMTSGTPPSTTGRYPGMFQMAPNPPRQACDPSIPQTAHLGGMVVAMADGSVRVVAPGISPFTFWSLVTPAGNEALGPDW